MEMAIRRYFSLLLLSLCVARQNMMVKHMVEIVVDRRQADRQTEGLKVRDAPQRHTCALPLEDEPVNGLIHWWKSEPSFPFSFKTNATNKQIPIVSMSL